MMCTTVLHGGVCHRTSTPHKSGNKMKEKTLYTLINKEKKILMVDYNTRTTFLGKTCHSRYGIRQVSHSGPFVLTLLISFSGRSRKLATRRGRNIYISVHHPSHCQSLTDLCR